MTQQDVTRVPKGWVEGTASDLVLNPKNDIVDGPFGSNLKASEYTDTGTPIVRIQNVKRFRFIDKNIHFVADEKAEQLKRHSFKGGDVLITKLGEPLGLACIAPEKFEFGIIVADIIRARPYVEISNKFMTYLLNSRVVIEQISKHTKGSTRARINLSVVRNLNIPIPPLPEQKRIVEKLDSLLAQVDTIQQRLNTLPNIIKRFRQSVLAAAVSGKLTPNKKFKTEPLINLVKILNGARKPVSATLRKDMQGEYPYYGATSIVDYVNGWTHDDNLLLVGEDGANLLTKAKDLAFKVSGKIWVNNHAHVLKENENVNLDYIRFAINSMDLSEWVTGSAQPKLTKTALQRLPITIPEFEEQTEIVRLVEQYFALADTLEKHLENAKQRVDNLTQAILAKAFKGELVPQDPSDEPAEQLLTRIKAAREQAEALEKAAKKVAKAKKK
jgi:type I restriction enzyme S subunit